MNLNEKFLKWLGLVKRIHPGFEFEPNSEVAWTKIVTPLPRARVALVTTAGVHRRDQPPFDEVNPSGDLSLRVIPSNTMSRDLQVTHAHYDHRDADKDINCVFPIDRLRELQTEGVIGELADTFFGMCGFTPQPRRFLAETAPQIVKRLKGQEVDVVLITAGCPVCHVSAAHIQGDIEAAGMTTVSVTVKPEVTRAVRVPRTVYVRFPLGNPFGEPDQPEVQRKILREVLSIIEKASQPETLVELPYRWRRIRFGSSGRE